MKKSQFGQFILTFLFGPLGLLYSSVGWGMGLLVAGIVVGALTMGLAALIVWPVSIIMGFVKVSAHNQYIEKKDRQHEEMMAATLAAASAAAGGITRQV